MAQGLAGAHAAAFGDAPHEHDGAPCVLALGSQADEDDAALPPVPCPLEGRVTPAEATAFALTAAIRPTVTAHPPGRAPPLSR